MIRTESFMKEEIKGVAASVTNGKYQDAVKIKMSRQVFKEYLEYVYNLGMINSILNLSFAYKSHLEHKATTPEEFSGDLDIEVVNAWKILSSSKLGLRIFQKISIEDLISSKDMNDVLKKGIIGETLVMESKSGREQY